MNLTEFIVPTIACALCMIAGYFFAWLSDWTDIKRLKKESDFWQEKMNQAEQECSELRLQRRALTKRAQRGGYLLWKSYYTSPSIKQEVLMYSSKPGGGFRVVVFDDTQEMKDEMEKFDVIWIATYDLIEGKAFEPNSLWLTVYECRDEVVRISPDGLGFYAPGQDACWSLDAARFIRKIEPSREDD